MQTRHANFFSYGIGGLKPPLVDIRAPPKICPDHQVSSGQELDLTAKTHTK